MGKSLKYWTGKTPDGLISFRLQSFPQKVGLYGFHSNGRATGRFVNCSDRMWIL